MSAVEYSQEQIERGVSFGAKRLPLRPIEIPTPEDMFLPADTVARDIAIAYGITVSALRGRSRTAHIAAARRQFCLAMRAQNWSLPAIGRWLQRDHTTILYACSSDEQRKARAERKKIQIATRETAR